MASRGFISPFTVGFGLCLIPTAAFFVYGYKSPEERVQELERKGYIAPRQQSSAGSPSSSLVRGNSKTNQQLLQSIFDNRNEPDLYKSLRETDRRAPADAVVHPQAATKS